MAFQYLFHLATLSDSQNFVALPLEELDSAQFSVRKLHSLKVEVERKGVE